MLTPLYFYPPGGGGEDPPFASDAAAAYDVDLEAHPAVAIGKDGTRHAIVIKTYGRVPWIEKAVRAHNRANGPDGEVR
jgi:hypothetical protein